MTVVEVKRPVRRHRSLFLSDMHLGGPGCRAEAIFDFLARNDADTIYLVGDSFDLWHPLIVSWGEAEARIVSLLRERAESGRRILWLVGNHDRALLTERGRNARGIDGLVGDVLTHAVHVGGDGRRYLVLHGDVCDARLLRFHFWTRIGSRVESIMRLTDAGLRLLRLRFGDGARGPLDLLITGLNGLIYRGRTHERRLVALARDAGCDGVICGHYHIAALHDDHGLRYANCGDWTDSCTALVEHWDGTLVLEGQGTTAGAVMASPVARGA